MRFINLFLLGLLPFAFAYPSAANEDAMKERILNHLRAATSLAEIQEPSSDIVTLSPFGPELYRSLVGEELYPRLVNAIVYIVTEEGVTGSGTVISSSFGLIIANWHVIGREKVVGLVFKPKGSNGSIYFDKDDIFLARVLITDSIRDLALLEIVSRPRKLMAVPLGSMSHLRAGHNVFSVSHPRGSLWSYSEGIIRQISPNNEWVSAVGTIHRATTIGTQNVRSNGSSGDPLFDEDGQFIGILVGTTGTEPNFAISIDEIRDFVFSSLR